MKWLLLLFVCLLTVSCGGESVETDGDPIADTGADAAAVPALVSAAGEFQVCVDIAYPPAEFYAEDGTTPTGFDIDLAQEIADRWQVPLNLVETGFDAIIPALTTEKCHAIISALTNNEDRREQIDFVNYVDVGSAFVVPPGNPLAISSIEDLCGTAVAIIIGENWRPFLEDQSAACEAAGAEPIEILEYNTSADQVNQLTLGRVAAIVTNSINGAWLAAEHADDLELAEAEPFTQNPMGVGIRKGSDDLESSLVKTIQEIYDAGRMDEIFAEYGMSAVFLPHEPSADV